MEKVEQYRVLEMEVPAEMTTVTFRQGDAAIAVRTFFDGPGRTLARFMPTEPGIWEYDGGSFLCAPASGNNHGPVQVDGKGFRYADDTRFLPFGTTCYAWTHQTEELRRQTLESLKASPFNKVRMCVFPKSMVYSMNEPARFPFLKDEEGRWDIHQPDVAFWRDFETQIAALDRLGVEADIILFHPYDRWGFASLSQEDSLIYLEYCVSRLSAYKNVWWSLANEYNLVPGKTDEDWDAFARRVQELDSSRHLLSIHNFGLPHPNQDWMTHCSIQSDYCRRVITWRENCQKPVIIDECGYEGTIEFAWGNLSAFEMVHRFWTAVCCGGYCTHGETFYQEDEILWWAKGGELKGRSMARIAFLKNLLESLPGTAEPVYGAQMAGDPNGSAEAAPFINVVMSMPVGVREAFIAEMIPMACGNGEDWRLYYQGRSCSAWVDVQCPGEGNYTTEVIDIWEMTRTPTGTVSGNKRIDLPGKEGQAVLLRKIEEEKG